LLDDGRIRIHIRELEDLDPDPGGPKTYGSDRSGSATLVEDIHSVGSVTCGGSERILQEAVSTWIVHDDPELFLDL
jgi:hypothetical protein